jgi:signal peptidase I
MYPTFHENDFIIVDKVSPRFTDYKRGDVIVFVPPGKEIPYIKRVIGTPGDIIKINDGYVYICHTTTGPSDCQKLEEKYLPAGLLTDTYEQTEFVVGTG